jgi:hypothetical protein
MELKMSFFRQQAIRSDSGGLNSAGLNGQLFLPLDRSGGGLTTNIDVLTRGGCRPVK